ncbi:PREDICTED: uncharacterized protein LOC109340826 [Lupinus angustifolius]|uniref:uncharacterized protein LOC109340826 n=1 Tax=Lupinus angustifolius TaxID=3871 RepID=UPI00092E4532|nr:PREDICTED: uncharacterized protein LOC109340826 [Lupinus angustifolius]
MAPKREEAGPIPTGWASKPLVEKSGSKSLFYCPATGQQFDSYFGLMHYVKYAMRNKLSIYEPVSLNSEIDKALISSEYVHTSQFDCGSYKRCDILNFVKLILPGSLTEYTVLIRLEISKKICEISSTVHA